MTEDSFMKKLTIRLTLLEVLFGITVEEALFAQNYDLPSKGSIDKGSDSASQGKDSLLNDELTTFYMNDHDRKDIYDDYGMRVYRASEIRELLKNEISTEYVEYFKSVRKKNQKPIFDVRDIVKFYKNDVSLETAKKIIDKKRNPKRRYLLKSIYHQQYTHWKKAHKELPKIFRNKENFKTLYSLSLVKRSHEYFHDTEKPRLMITYPLLDYNKALFTPSARDLIKTLSDTYDIWFVTLRNDSDLLKALESAPTMDAMIISGHGSRESILLNEPTEGLEEISYIDVGDAELKKYFKYLPDGSTIFLNACNTAKTHDTIVNLAETISRSAPGKKVIASTEEFSIGEIIIKKAYPLDLEIPNKTYIAKHEH